MKKLSHIFFLFFCISCFSQDPLFTNTNQSLVYLNPSFAGTNGLVRNQFLYRNQWPSLSGNFVTYYNGLDIYIKPMRGGLAFTYSHDDQARGTLKTDAFNLTYSQHFSLCDKKLKIIPSIQAGYFIKKLDRTKLNFGDMIDPRQGFAWNSFQTLPSATKSNFDFSSGLLINYNHFYFGASVFHFNQPDEGLLGVSKKPFRLNIHGSYNLLIGEKTIIQFFTLYQQQQKFYALEFALNAVLFKSLIIGAGYRSADAINLNIGYRNNCFTIQCGYDVTVSKLAGATAGSWEVSAAFNLRNKDLRKVLSDFERW